LLIFPAFKGDDWYVFVFIAKDFSGELQENHEGYLEWIPDDRLESLPLWPSDHIFFPWFRQGKLFSAKFVYEGNEIKDHSVTFYRP